MEFQDVVRRRRMVRRYADRPVDAAIVDRALENATHAPSAGFSQGWAFLRLDTPEDVRRFWAASSDDIEHPSAWLAGLMTAPVVIVPCSSKAAYLERYAQPDKGWTDRAEPRWSMPYWHMDAAMASLLILQTATDAGLGACFFGTVRGREQQLREAFDIPEDYDPVGVITIGHRQPDTGSAGSPARRPRTPWTEVVHRGRWGH
ncbi:nitroreductase family protein [Nocardioides sp. cx-173]|uniref:nitroreductase family protein n=1 Tax=Nocardioides sp. cx-173 TaxID=2898796 RepID=UPI001E315E4F|nr:nitroreductase family protein [Nocardioides sp. cx-173]MCD4524302.1 nitroreductase family protein [Nocardioides sp. cx-173]UGB41693.1 nitroreductase family protein [Nocardioides sp. cx-173]